MWPVGYDGKPIQSTKSYYPTMSFWEGNSSSFEINDFEDQSQLTTKITERAVDFINQNHDKPFFLYIPILCHISLSLYPINLKERVS